MQRLILLTTPGCHLCLDARALIDNVAERVPLEVIEVDIATDDAMIERYGLSIPVVRTVQGRELAWPFTQQQLDEWLGEPHSATR